MSLDCLAELASYCSQIIPFGHC